MLVVACPCAVASRRRWRPRSASAGWRDMDAWSATRSAEALACTKLMAFDKTGTLTFGRARVVAIESDGVGTKDVLARAAGLEHSEHGFARAIALAAAVRGGAVDHPRRADCAGPGSAATPMERRWLWGTSL